MCVLSIKVPIRKKSGNLFNDPRVNLCGLFNAKATIVEKHRWYFNPLLERIRWFNNLFKGISPKVNVIASLETELASFETLVRRFYHYATEYTSYGESISKPLSLGMPIRYLAFLYIILIAFSDHSRYPFYTARERQNFESDSLL